MEKQIIIKSLMLTNFKGIRDFEAEFNDTITSVFGRNGSGKTTLFDAFTYVLFGKDSKDRKDFNIKTLDADNKPIPKLPHEVKCVLSVNGQEIELRRCYCEKWTKKRGSATEEFTGNGEERYYNGVPCSVKEYDAKVAEICDETVFKFITNPLYFTSQKKDIQRAMLFRMAGEISDAEIAKGNADFENLLDKLTGKSLDEYKREIAAKKKRIKESIESLPSRIDERKRDAGADEDWDAVEAELALKQQELADSDKELLDISKAYEARNGQRKALYEQLSEVNSLKMNREVEIKTVLLADYNKAVAERSELKSKIEVSEREIKYLNYSITCKTNEIAGYRKQREELLEEWKSIKAETLTFSEDEFICPTCGRKYEIDEIESKQAEMTERFQRNKAEKLEVNKIKGLDVKQKISDAETALGALQADLALRQAENQALKESPILRQEMQKPDTTGVVEKDKQYIELCNKELDIKNQLDAFDDAGADDSELKAKRASIIEAITELNKTLSKKDMAKRNEERIAELEEELRTQSQALTELEGIEFTIAQFSKAKVERVEERINAMFKTVKFKMFEQQINGGELETCEAMVDGVPFSDLNNAGRINAGLDIINAICRFEEVYAPIFIDNAESVNKLLPVNSQSIRLIVSEHKTLVIE